MKILLATFGLVPAFAVAQIPAYSYTHLNLPGIIFALNNKGDVLNGHFTSNPADVVYTIHDRNLNLVHTSPSLRDTYPFIHFYFAPLLDDNREVVVGANILDENNKIVRENIIRFKTDGSFVNHGVYSAYENYDLGNYVMNNQGQVAISYNYETSSSTPPRESAIYTPGLGWQPITMPAGSSSVSEVTDMNDSGVVVGTNSGGPFIWDAVNGARFIGTELGLVFAINENGHVAGLDARGSYVYNSQTDDLRYLGANFLPQFINSANVIVGSGQHVVMFSDEFGMVAVEDCLPEEGWIFTSVWGFNDAGEILAQGRNESLGLSGTFLLRPVPEPSTYALMALGLAAIAYLRRRR